MTNEKTVRLNEIAFDAGTQVRAEINQDVVAEYAGRQATGETFPPIVLFHDGATYYLADGFHRVMAAHRNEWMSIRADVKAGTKTDALWFALGANKANGQRLTSADKKHAILLALKTWPDRSINQIAEQIGVNQRYASEVKSQVSATTNLPDRVTGKDGKSYPSSRPESAARHPKAEEVESALRAGEKVTAIAKAVGIAPKTVTAIGKAAGIERGPDRSKAAVEQRRKDIADMARRGFTTRQISQHIGVSEPGVAQIAKDSSIVIHADRVVGKIKRHNSTRIVEQMVMDAENLTADVSLIEFGDLDKSKIGTWVESLKHSQRDLGDFVKRLIKEQSKHGQAA